ncbi:hypothetical protein H696_03765 [Fonticula alba]|uniref:WW domain-containing protein n=1 Tax=Fonticula alba TaxID=691883 RepID=A0A058Z5W6_FONAL|nr:hypothetical protein H696_03765 [Fonticula alba]KCV69333.1 hypothetical protein H696_03765 [Fonticula alba]|eukprot:XP_009495898.1 hypothetical protein H696_03765 [Fonticula alba]
MQLLIFLLPAFLAIGLFLLNLRRYLDMRHKSNVALRTKIMSSRLSAVGPSSPPFPPLGRHLLDDPSMAMSSTAAAAAAAATAAMLMAGIGPNMGGPSAAGAGPAAGYGDGLPSSAGPPGTPAGGAAAATLAAAGTRRASTDYFAKSSVYCASPNREYPRFSRSKVAPGGAGPPGPGTAAAAGAGRFAGPGYSPPLGIGADLHANGARAEDPGDLSGPLTSATEASDSDPCGVVISASSSSLGRFGMTPGTGVDRTVTYRRSPTGGLVAASGMSTGGPGSSSASSSAGNSRSASPPGMMMAGPGASGALGVAALGPVPSPGLGALSAAEDLLRPLPAGWQRARTLEGRVFFVDHNSRTTTWLDPRLGATSATMGPGAGPGPGTRAMTATAPATTTTPGASALPAGVGGMGLPRSESLDGPISAERYAFSPAIGSLDAGTPGEGLLPPRGPGVLGGGGWHGRGVSHGSGMGLVSEAQHLRTYSAGVPMVAIGHLPHNRPPASIGGGGSSSGGGAAVPAAGEGNQNPFSTGATTIITTTPASASAASIGGPGVAGVGAGGTGGTHHALGAGARRGTPGRGPGRAPSSALQRQRAAAAAATAAAAAGTPSAGMEQPAAGRTRLTPAPLQLAGLAPSTADQLEDDAFTRSPSENIRMMLAARQTSSSSSGSSDSSDASSTVLAIPSRAGPPTAGNKRHNGAYCDDLQASASSQEAELAEWLISTAPAATDAGSWLEQLAVAGGTGSSMAVRSRPVVAPAAPAAPAVPVATAAAGRPSLPSTPSIIPALDFPASASAASASASAAAAAAAAAVVVLPERPAAAIPRHMQALMTVPPGIGVMAPPGTSAATFLAPLPPPPPPPSLVVGDEFGLGLSREPTAECLLSLGGVGGATQALAAVVPAAEERADSRHSAPMGSVPMPAPLKQPPSQGPVMVRMTPGDDSVGLAAATSHQPLQHHAQTPLF